MWTLNWNPLNSECHPLILCKQMRTTWWSVWPMCHWCAPPAAVLLCLHLLRLHLDSQAVWCLPYTTNWHFPSCMAFLKEEQYNLWTTNKKSWLFHFNVWQNPLQIKKKLKKKIMCSSVCIVGKRLCVLSSLWSTVKGEEAYSVWTWPLSITLTARQPWV